MSSANSQSLVLVVDDTALSRKKLCKALDAIGIPSVVACDGNEALALLDQGDITLVLLDIVMPELDGFGVLKTMKASPKLSEIPVLVISSLEESQDIARALHLGAVDFLPKDVDAAIFRARVLGTLEKKRLRNVELAYFQDVELLTDAARQIRAGHIDPKQLPVKAVAARDDGLGNLARVFSELAEAVHRRERTARQRINLLQGCLLLLVMGLSWGIVPALSKIMVGPTALHPVGVAAWVALVTLSVVTILMTLTGKRPKFTFASLRFGVIAGLFAGFLPQVALFWVSAHVPGVVLSITLAMESLIVFAIAATLRIETPSLLRLSGLLLGLFAVFLIVFTSKEADGIGAPIWVLAGLIVPLSYAIESILVASAPDNSEQSPIELLFFIMLGSSLWGWGGATLTGSVLNPWTAETATVLLIATIGLMSAISNGCYVLTIRKMGAVFASQYAYVVTIMGVGWSVLLLDERLTVWIWLALGSVMVGMFMVRPKDQPTTLSQAMTATEPDPIPMSDSRALS